MIHAFHWLESVDAPTHPVFACSASGTIGAIEQYDPHEVLVGTVEFQRFYPLFFYRHRYSCFAKGGRLALGLVARFSVLVV